MPTAEELIHFLHLQPHPKEGGFFRETYRAAESIEPCGKLGLEDMGKAERGPDATVVRAVAQRGMQEAQRQWRVAFAERQRSPRNPRWHYGRVHS